jgi:signal transduction histidine kinase/CheY-like chemotaxis protein/CHASE3 domain sensor protein/HAMP domain-containing protein
MKRAFGGQLRLGFWASFALLVISALLSYNTISELIRSAGLVEHTNEVLKVSENLISTAKDGETGQRGYLITGQEDFLVPYNGSFEKVNGHIQRLRELTIANIDQQQQCDSLELMWRSRFGLMQLSVEDKRAGRQINSFLLRDGKALMDRMRLVVQRIQHVEQNLLLERTQRLDRYIRFAPITIILATLLAMAITWVYFRRLVKDAREKQGLNDSLIAKDHVINERIRIIQSIAGQVASGDYKVRVNEEQSDSLGILSVSLNKMAASLDHSFSELQAREWLQSGASGLSEQVAGEKTVHQIAEEAISFITNYTGSLCGALYVTNGPEHLELSGTFALPATQLQQHFAKGEGLPGQCLRDRQMLRIENIDDQLFTTAATGSVKPRHLIFWPVLFEGGVRAVIELGTIENFEERHIHYLRHISELLGITIETAINRDKLKELLEETQSQAEELQAQHRELEDMNAELEAQSEKLQTSEEELRVQQEELMETNQELEERSRQLEEKNQLVLVRNLDIQKKVEELAESTRYKSEFLANMSHELRTPLNSILLLSRLLGENNPGTLTNEQVEFAQIIQSSGQGLLQLIDEILDLSKIESGKVDVEYERVSVEALIENVKAMFLPMAKEKSIDLHFALSDAIPSSIETDKVKVEQILRNLIANALKFTAKGSIDVNIDSSPDGQSLEIAVIDTGIGIAHNKQEQIFTAFQQADGSTKRKYGGTGLGLSISRQLARLLGGDITVESEPGKGSRFVLELPVTNAGRKKTVKEKTSAKTDETVTPSETRRLSMLAETIPDALPDDRADLGPEDKILLIVEDDINFARALVDFAKQKSYKIIHSVRGDEVIELAQRFKPTGILLDIQLPMKDGLSVMDELKKNPRTRSIPVHVMSSFELKKESLLKGAVDFINKPVAFEQMNEVLQKIENAVKVEKKVLIVEDNTQHAKALAHFLSQHQINAEISADIDESVETLQQKQVSCVILDIGAGGNKSYEVLEQVKQNSKLGYLPVIVFTGKTITRQDEMQIRQYADAIVVKTAQSYERILNEVSLFLHLVEAPGDGKSNGKGNSQLDATLRGKTVLIADDDVRNIFALTKVLEKHQMNIVTAIDGREALNQMETTNQVDIVLMDMMMPEMDGYEAIRRIREERKWKRLPIIALTAKAMAGDREKCMEAGASDYISKPVDTDQLLSLIRVWLYDSI